MSNSIQEKMLEDIPKLQWEIRFKFGHYYNDENKYGLFYYVNGVKIEWQVQSKKIKIGTGHSEEDYYKLIKFYKQHGIICKRTDKGNLPYLDKDPKICDFIEMFEITILHTIKLEKPMGYGKITSSENPFQGMARIINISLRFGLPIGSRCYGLWDNDILIKNIYINTPDKKSKKTYKEHLVPCKVIMDKCVESFRLKKASWKLIEELIKTNLKVAYITAGEADKLNKKYRQSMPKSWDFGENIYARLIEEGIEISNFIDENIEKEYNTAKSKTKK